MYIVHSTLMHTYMYNYNYQNVLAVTLVRHS